MADTARTEYELTVSVLGYREDVEWVALGLEVDLRGYGETFDAAMHDLLEQITMQIGFAHFKGDPDMVLHPAAPTYWNLYAQARQDALRARVLQSDETESEYRVAGLPFPPAHVIAQLKGEFAPSTDG